LKRSEACPAGLNVVGMARFFDNYLTTLAGKYTNEVC